MSSKNTLQEFCIKEHYTPPSYATKKIGGEDHDPQFISFVTVTSGEKSLTVPGEVCSSKISAEKSAAQNALDSLISLEDEKEKVQIKEEPTAVDKATDATAKVLSPSDVRDTPGTENAIENPIKVCILIDVENLPTMVFPSVALKNSSPLQIDIYVFVGRHHHSVDKNLGKNVEKIIVPTTRKDGVDTFIQMFAAISVQNSKYSHYVIVTRDHFGYALAELIRSGGYVNNEVPCYWKPKKAEVVTSVDQLKKFIAD